MIVAATLVSLLLAPLGASPDSCGCDSLDVQRAVGQSAYASASAWAGPGVPLTPPRRAAGYDSLRFYVVQSTATDTRATYRARCWWHGRPAPWTLPIGVVTSARDTAYTLMSADGRIAGEWVMGANGSARIPALRWAYMDSTVRCVSQSQVQLYWWDRVRAIFGYVR